jgi:hypothetical protein
MGRWTLLLGGMIVWAIHFGGLYVLGSLAAITPPADAGLWRAIILVLSAACLAAAGGVASLAFRKLKRPGPDEEPGRFVSQVAVAGAGLSALAIVWQTTAALIAD